jgi:hypothetical protein
MTFVLVVLVFAGALLSFGALALFDAPDAQALDLGTLSRKYETGGDPTVADPDWGYGAYQMLGDTAYNYSVWLSKNSKAKYRAWGRALVVAHDTLDKGKDGGVYFNATYKAVAGGTLSAKQKKRYAKVLSAYKKKDYSGTYANSIPAGNKKNALSLQYKYAIKVYYKPAVKNWKKVAPGFDPTDYSIALRSVIFSSTIANGPTGSANKIFKNALSTLGGWKTGMGEKKLINAIYNEWGRTAKWKKSSESGNAVKITTDSLNSDLKSVVSKYKLSGRYLKHYFSSTAAVQVSVFRRVYVNERADALALYKTYKPSNCKHGSTSGGKVLKVYGARDAYFKELVSLKKCRLCGKTLSKQHVAKVKCVYVKNGTSYKESHTGHLYTVHKNKRYYLVTTGVTMRKSASTKAKARMTVPALRIVKTRAIKMGKDGYWWGKVKVGKKTGWVQMRYLSIRGTASTPSYTAKKVNRYTKLTKKQTERLFAIKQLVSTKSRKLTLKSSVNAYANAYANKRGVKKTYSAGKKLKVVKVVTNRYHMLFAKLKNGSYVPLTAFK